MMKTDLLQNREILVEFFSVGSYMKVSAMDVKTLTEISISGPVSTPQKILEQNALKRLEYVLKKKELI